MATAVGIRRQEGSRPGATPLLTIGLAMLVNGCGGNKDVPDPLSKSVVVFGVMVRATDATPDEKILHAARVLAEYLDGDEDGAPDNPAVVHELVARSATLVMTRDEAELDSIASDFRSAASTPPSTTSATCSSRPCTATAPAA